MDAILLSSLLLLSIIIETRLKKTKTKTLRVAILYPAVRISDVTIKRRMSPCGKSIRYVTNHPFPALKWFGEERINVADEPKYKAQKYFICINTDRTTEMKATDDDEAELHVDCRLTY